MLVVLFSERMIIVVSSHLVSLLVLQSNTGKRGFIIEDAMRPDRIEAKLLLVICASTICSTEQTRILLVVLLVRSENL